MKIALLISTSVLTFASIVAPAHADMPKTGASSQGVYWKLEKDTFGKTYYECYDESTQQRVNEQKCTDANAKKPAKVTRRTDLFE